MKTKTLCLIFLNKEVWQETIGTLPDCYLSGTVGEVETPANWNGKLTKKMKEELIAQYWIKAGGTGGYKMQEKLDHKLFRFNTVN